tara:strand:- start:141 stop:392 length:252 start_codon:yes stop_codon:yes gene_type:complete
LKKSKIKILWPNEIINYASDGDDWFLMASKAGFKIPTGCLTGSCGACEIDVNGETVRPCINNINSKKNCFLRVTLTADPFWSL